jgi:hypothetical protein
MTAEQRGAESSRGLAALPGPENVIETSVGRAGGQPHVP